MWTALFSFLLAGFGFTPLEAQEPVALASQGSAAVAANQQIHPLDRPAGVDVREASLAEVLLAIRDRSGVPITFSPSLVEGYGAVECRCSTRTVREALDQILADTRFEWTSVGRGVLVEIQEPSEPGLTALQVALAPEPVLTQGLGGEAPGLEPLRATARTGTIQGRVTHGRTGQALTAVQVFVTGTQQGAITDNTGAYQISGVGAGTVTVEAQLIGFAAVRQEVTVVSGETVQVDFQLTERALDLDGIVVTGTAGGTQRRAIGNVVATVDAEEIMSRAPIGNVDQLLGQRTPGAMMLPGTGQVGTGSAIRIRGNSSLALANEPIIYIDGVRMDSDPRRGPAQRGGANVSRLNDIHPGDIASIEIIKGPAAATLYGTEASNGVIQIITKRGASGAPQFDVTTRTGTNWLWNPEGRTGMRYMPDPNNPGELIGFNVYQNERENGLGDPFGYGLLQSYNLSVRGGTDAVRYFASVSRDDDTGIVSHNWDRRTTLRANMEVLLSDNLTMTVGSSYITGETRLAQGAINPDPFSNLIWSNPRNLNDNRRGWRQAPPENWGEVESRSDNNRTTSNVELRYQPVAWSSHRLVVGLDDNSEVTSTLYPQHPDGAEHVYGQLSLGQKSVSRGTRRFITFDYSGSARATLGTYDFETAVGFQYYRSESSFINSFGAQFPAVPITTVSGGAVRDGGESFLENSTVGVYFQQQVGWENRRFITAAVRADDNSAFGVEFDAAIYPKLSATWVMHEEDFWRFDQVDQLRLRMAWGAAGQQPGTFDASRLYNPTIGYRDRPALLPAAFGNPQLKPERGEELEVGFDASFLDGRIDLEFTRYDRRIRDAIVNRPLPPSSGFTGSQIVNIGLIHAWGNEIGLSARVLESPRFRWEVDTQFSTMENEIKDLGGLEFVGAPGQAQHREGYSIGDFFMRDFLEVDIDETGRVLRALCDGGAGPQGVHPGGAPVPCGEAPQVWVGSSQPTWQFGVGNTFTLFENLSLYARVEGSGGHYHTNTEIRAMHNQATTEDVLRRDNAFLQAIRIFENDRTSLYEAGFLRLREVSATYFLPDNVAARVGASRGSVSLGMRNLAMLWTAEHGWSTPRDGSILEPLAGITVWDPEVRSTGQSATGYQTVLPPTASATLSVRLSF
ncbi:MAG: SusC/RagA family TonB-linked outer membrane protein [Gemmatimonadales bacterium]|nr:MAG: SusC/RagA family TonB-linked outer membrane protein [Gemmatimonadales bacterium]